MSLRALFICLPFAAGAVLTLALAIPCRRGPRLGRRALGAWAAAVFLCCSKFLCFAVFGGDAFNPELPAAVIWIWDWLYSGAMILLPLTLAAYFVRSRAKLLVLPVLAWSVAARGVWNGVKTPEVREVELAFADLPDSLDGYRIVQLSDLHVSSSARRARTEAVVARANAAKADLVVVTGDVVDGTVGRRAADVEPLRALAAPDGVWYVAGNHEFYNDWSEWSAWFASAGMRFLHNACVFPRPGLALGGVVDDGSAARGGEGPDVAAAFATATNGEFRVLLEHRPAHARENFAQGRVGLQLSGHTHGGVAPLMRRLVARHNGGFVRGAYPMGRPGEGCLYVSPGSGQWAGFPVRLFTPSEITALTLRKL